MSPGAPPPTKIFVGRLPTDGNASELRRLFEKYGVVTECDILNRYGFVHMKTEEMATKAIRELNGKEFMGSRISVEASTGKRGGGGRDFRGRGGGRGGRGGGGFRSGPYERSGPRDYDRGRPSMDSRDRMGGGGMGGRNGFYDRGSYADDYYSRRPMMPSMGSRDMMYSRDSRYSMDLYERRAPLPSISSPYERRDSYGGGSSLGVRNGGDVFRRRSPVPPLSGYDRGASAYDAPRDPYGGPPMRRPYL